MQNRPAVSVIVPFHREERFIADAVASLRGQTRRDFEAILVDNRSRDDSARVARAAAEDDDRFLFEVEPEPGIDRALTRGLSRASGAWVTFLDADDFFLPTRLERAIQVAEAERADLVVCRALKVDASGHVFGESERLVFTEETYPLMLLQRNISWSLSFLTVKAERLASLGRLPGQYNALLDLYVLLEACRRGWRLAFVDEPLVGKREHDGNYSSDDLRQMAQEIPLVAAFLESCARARRFFSPDALRRIMTGKYLRGVQYARRHGRVADIPDFTTSAGANPWVDPAFGRFFSSMARLQTGGEEAFLLAIGPHCGHPLDDYTRGIASFLRENYREAADAFEAAARPLRGRFPEAELGRTVSIGVGNPRRGRRLLRQLLNVRPDYLDAWIAWQAPAEELARVRLTRFPSQSSLDSLLHYRPKGRGAAG